jgi:3-methyladenine DNA glycosylase AlkD
MTPTAAARDAMKTLAGLSRPVASFDASRYFRGADRLGFRNVGAPMVRRLARDIHAAHRTAWTVDDALAFAEATMRSRFLEDKGVGIELLARYRRAFAPRHLSAWKRWLASDLASNWATTDAMCGLLIGPLLVARPALLPRVAAWAGHRNLWVRRASTVALIPSVRRGVGLDLAYGVAARLHPDEADLIQKAVGWMLREAGKTDSRRLEKYLCAHGPSIPRTTLRYAIERFPPARRRRLLRTTRAAESPV